jgi:deoxyhypusine synthase
MENDSENVKGMPPTKDMTVKQLVDSMKNVGFQATHIYDAVKLIKKMRSEKATIFLSFTSNMVSSGLREYFAYLVKNKMVDVIVTSVGSIEEDFMKSKTPFLIGSFDVSDKDLHKRGINRIGNIFVPNKHYEELEKGLTPFFTELLENQKETGKMISPSDLISELGKKIDDKNSILYWATKNNIPIFCPGITDGAFGLQLYFFKNLAEGNKELGIDVTADMDKIANIVYDAEKTGGIILGGGIAKHHTIGVNIVRDGLDYAVYVSTGTEYDGSLSGARPKEAKSWGKIKEEANNVFVEGDATIVFPLILNALIGE